MAYRIYVNGKHGGYFLRGAAKFDTTKSNIVEFPTYEAAVTEIAARGYTNSVGVDCDDAGKRLRHTVTTAYVVAN